MPALPPVKKFVSQTGVRIYRIPCQTFPAFSARVYLLLGAGQPTLVDTGSGLGTSTRDILVGMETVRQEFGEPVRVGDIRRIIVSHGHTDHVGGLPDLLPLMAAQVAIHPFDRRGDHREPRVLPGQRRLAVFCGKPASMPARRKELISCSQQMGRPVDGGASGIDARGWPADRRAARHSHSRPFARPCLPGHRQRVALGRPHPGETIPHQCPLIAAGHTGLGCYLASLEKIERMPGFTLTLAAHEQVIHNVYHRIATIRAAIERRLEWLLTILGEASRPLTVDELARQLYPEVTNFRAVLAITDVGARVEYLQRAGPAGGRGCRRCPGREGAGASRYHVT